MSFQSQQNERADLACAGGWTGRRALRGFASVTPSTRLFFGEALSQLRCRSFLLNQQSDGSVLRLRLAPWGRCRTTQAQSCKRESAFPRSRSRGSCSSQPRSIRPSCLERRDVRRARYVGLGRIALFSLVDPSSPAPRGPFSLPAPPASPRSASSGLRGSCVRRSAPARQTSTHAPEPPATTARRYDPGVISSPFRPCIWRWAATAFWAQPRRGSCIAYGPTC
jgi:hypothetical protein